MPDIPLPKPPKPSGLGNTTPTTSQSQTGGSQEDLTPPPSRLVTQSSKPPATNQPTSLGQDHSVPRPKPPAAVTALHSVTPVGAPTNQHPDNQASPTPSTVVKPTLDDKAKIKTQLGKEVGRSSQVIGGNQPPPNQTSSTPVKPAQPRSSWLSKLPFIFGGLAILLLVVVLGVKLFSGRSKPTTPATPQTNPQQGSEATQDQTTPNQVANTQPEEVVELEYWGLWEPEEVMQPVIDEFKKQHPNISVRYVKQSPKNYRERLQTAIASGNGPDVFRYHATWVPMLADDLAPLPASIMSPSEFQQTFYPVATKQLQHNGQLVGLPLEYDGLVLFYNQDILQAANEPPPTSWAQVRSLAKKLTLKEGNKIKRAGIALGTAENTDHFSDILGVLMLQNGADLTNPDTPEVRDALIFYTNFVKTDGVWDETLPNSTVAFARGEAAMLLAPSWRAHEIKEINPELKFAAAPLPQVVEDNAVAWATYWAEGVNKQSKNQEAAWQLLKFLVSAQAQKKFFAQASTTRMFGEPYSRVDLAGELANDPILASLFADAPKAEGWYLSSNTFDNGLNDQIIKYYKDAVNALLAGKDITKVLPTLSQGVQQVLSQYNVTK